MVVHTFPLLPESTSCPQCTVNLAQKLRAERSANALCEPTSGKKSESAHPISRNSARRNLHVWISAFQFLPLSARQQSTSARLGRVCEMTRPHTTSSGSIGVLPRQARFPFGAVPHSGLEVDAFSSFGTRAVRWIPWLSAELLQGLIPFEALECNYATGSSAASSPWRWMPPGVGDFFTVSFKHLGSRSLQECLFAAYCLCASRRTTSIRALCVDSQWC